MRFFVRASALFLTLTCGAALAQGVATEYAGSKVCAACHRAIYETYHKTAVGRVLDVAANDPGLKALLKPITVYNRVLDRYFEVSREGDEFFQSEYQSDAQRHEVFRAKHKVEYAVGSGINDVGYLIRRSQFHFHVKPPVNSARRLQFHETL